MASLWVPYASVWILLYLIKIMKICVNFSFQMATSQIQSLSVLDLNTFESSSNYALPFLIPNLRYGPFAGVQFRSTRCGSLRPLRSRPSLALSRNQWKPYFLIWIIMWCFTLVGCYINHLHISVKWIRWFDFPDPCRPIMPMVAVAVVVLAVGCHPQNLFVLV